MLWYCHPPAWQVLSVSLMSLSSLLGNHSDLSTSGNQTFSGDWGSHLSSGELSRCYFQFAKLDFLPLCLLICYCTYLHHITFLCHYEFPFLMLSLKGLWQSWGEKCEVRHRERRLANTDSLVLRPPCSKLEGALADVNLRHVSGIGFPGST